MGCSPPVSSVIGIPPGKNIGVGCRFFLQGVFLTQELNFTSPALVGRFFTTRDILDKQTDGQMEHSCALKVSVSLK